MAGAGYKLFVNGNALSASDLNTYVQQQTVMVFASASARTTALASVLAEGMVSYRIDSHVFEVYNGTSWVSAGISSPRTTKGDLWGFDTAGNRIPVGSNNQVLTADSTQVLGLKWATPTGSMTSIATGTLSGATVTISSIPQTYINLYLVVKNPSVASGGSGVQFNINGLTTTYAITSGRMSITTLTANNRDWALANPNATNNYMTAITYYNYAATNIQNFSFIGYNGNNNAEFGWGAKTDTTTAISSLTITVSSSTFNGGTYTLYGVN